MKFKAKRICKGNLKVKNKYWRQMVRWFGLRGSVLLIAFVCFTGVIVAGANMLHASLLSNSTRSIFSLGPLDKDEFGHTNILFLGVAGEAEEGGNLSDSIMVVSINPNNPSASFLSLPRDLFIGSDIGDRKINEIYAAARFKHGNEEGLRIAERALSKFTGVDIQYGATINFAVFEDIIDAIGGIDIFVPQDIKDPFYPDGNYGYETFVVRKGMHHFDGKTALKYARSRKTSSDYDRARRQQDLILAIKKRAMDQRLLTDFDKLKKFYKIFREYVNTDLSISETIALAKIMVSIDYNNSVMAVLNDDQTKKDGFLYTPAREFYGGQFVLLPENLRDTQLFMNLVLIQPEILLENAQISILNGTSIQGKAGEASGRLRRFGFHVIETGNYESNTPIFRTFIRNYSGEKTDGTAKILSEILDAEIIPMGENVPPNPDNLIDIQVVLGTN